MDGALKEGINLYILVDVYIRDIYQQSTITIAQKLQAFINATLHHVIGHSGMAQSILEQSATLTYAGMQWNPLSLKARRVSRPRTTWYTTIEGCPRWD